MSTTPSSAHQAGPLCLKCPKPFLEIKTCMDLDSFPFLSPYSSPRLRGLREGCVGSRTGEDAGLFGDGLSLWEEKVQEPLKEKRVHRGVIYRTGEGESRRKVGIADIIISKLPFTVSCPSFLKFCLNSTTGSASLTPPSPALDLVMNPSNSVCLITVGV